MKLLSLFALVIALSLTACGTTPTPPDQPPGQDTTFLDKVVTCTTDNAATSAAANSVLGCLTGAVSGNYVACISGLVTVGHWTVDEIACLVRAYSVGAAQRINAGYAKPEDNLTLTRANEWIKSNRVKYR